MSRACVKVLLQHAAWEVPVICSSVSLGVPVMPACGCAAVLPFHPSDKDVSLSEQFAAFDADKQATAI